MPLSVGAGDEDIKEPGVFDPGLTFGGCAEGVLYGNGVVLKNPVSGSKVPPEILVHACAWLIAEDENDGEETREHDGIEKQRQCGILGRAVPLRTAGSRGCGVRVDDWGHTVGLTV